MSFFCADRSRNNTTGMEGTSKMYFQKQYSIRRTLHLSPCHMIVVYKKAGLSASFFSWCQKSFLQVEHHVMVSVVSLKKCDCCFHAVPINLLLISGRKAHCYYAISYIWKMTLHINQNWKKTSKIYKVLRLKKRFICNPLNFNTFNRFLQLISFGAALVSEHLKIDYSWNATSQAYLSRPRLKFPSQLFTSCFLSQFGSLCRIFDRVVIKQYF